jgi:hypothetical protein
MIFQRFISQHLSIGFNIFGDAKTTLSALVLSVELVFLRLRSCLSERDIFRSMIIKISRCQCGRVYFF